MTNDLEKQTRESIDKNKVWFRSNDAYARYVQDAHGKLRSEIESQLTNAGNLLDIGNGGVFNYDTSLAEAITALDLSLDIFDGSFHPPHVTLLEGSALNIPIEDAHFDSVVMVMLLHHLVGATVAQSRENVRRCIAECRRVLKPGGRLVIGESCVPQWFYRFEAVVFPVALVVVDKLVRHPPALQYTAQDLKRLIEEEFSHCDVSAVPKGKYDLEFGLLVPTWLKPVRQFVFRAT